MRSEIETAFKHCLQGLKAVSISLDRAKAHERDEAERNRVALRKVDAVNRAKAHERDEAEQNRVALRSKAKSSSELRKQA